MKQVAVTLLAAMLVFAACGDDDGGDAGNDELVEGLTAQILADDDSDVPFTNEEAACFAVGLIDRFGGDRMVEAMDLEFEEFMAGASATERREVVDVMLDCADFGAMLTAEFATGISQDSAQCLGDAFVGSDAFRDAIADSLAGETAGDPFEDPDLLAEMLPTMLECLSAEELIQLGELGG